MASPAESDAQRLAKRRVGQMLDAKWRVERLIDVGGMGAVYVGVHRNGRRAALKVLHAQFAQNAEVRARFLREGYVANRIDHPGAVAILDDDTADDGAPFLVMELLEGATLSDLLAKRGGTLPVKEALAIGGQVLEVLEAAHAHGVVHRDVKPGNIFLTLKGEAKVLDFGLARIVGGGGSLAPTAMGTVMGTAGYLPPEQARGQTDRIDARSDLFAVGAVLFRAIVGRRVHEHRSAIETTLSAMKDPAPALASVFPAAGPALSAAIDRALAFEKENRWPSANEMFVALRAAYDEEARPPARATTASATPASATTAAPSPARDANDVSVLFEPMGGEETSLFVEVAFGGAHDMTLDEGRTRKAQLLAERGGAAGAQVASGDDEPTSARPPRA